MARSSNRATNDEPCAKDQKLANQEVVDSADRISGLHDSVLIYILGFLTAKEVVATSVLSKRWEFLWTNVLHLHFEDDITDQGEETINRRNRMSFNNFVNRVMLQHNGPSIDKFCLHCQGSSDQFDFQSWIRTAISKNVREINLSRFEERLVYNWDLAFTLPRCVFTSKMLVALALDGPFLINIPSLVCFPKLITLQLSYVMYQNEDTIPKLLSGCLVLENLTIDRDPRDNVFTFNISSPTIKRLLLSFLSHGRSVFTRGNVLQINAPALQYLDIEDDFSERISITNVCSLIEANIRFSNPHNSNYVRFPLSVLKCLEAFQGVKFLSISRDTSNVLSSTALELLPTKFRNLIRLTLLVKCCKWHRLMQYFLKSSEKLEVLELKKVCKLPCRHCYHDKNLWINSEQVPQCLSSCLRSVSFHEFVGSEDEFAMIRYMLKNGKVLQTFKIHHSAENIYNSEVKPSFKRKLRALQRILKFPRGSETCGIIFS